MISKSEVKTYHAQVVSRAMNGLTAIEKTIDEGLKNGNSPYYFDVYALDQCIPDDVAESALSLRSEVIAKLKAAIVERYTAGGWNVEKSKNKSHEDEEYIVFS